MTYGNNETLTIRDHRGYKVLYMTDIITDFSIIELYLKESSRIRFVEIIEITKSHDTKLTVSSHYLNKFVMSLKNVLKYYTVNTKYNRNAKGSKQNKNLRFETEFNINERWKYMFQLNLDEDREILYVVCKRGKKLEFIQLLPSNLEEFITKCEIILNKFCDITEIYAESSTKLTLTKNKGKNENIFRAHSNNDANPTPSGDGKNGGWSSILEVLDDPLHRQIVHEDITLTLEIVKGNKTFLRITEIIKEKIKDIVHVPIECIEHFAETVQDIWTDIVSIVQDDEIPSN